MKDYCPMCEEEKETAFEYKDDYICESCYAGLADRLEYQYQE